MACLSFSVQKLVGSNQGSFLRVVVPSSVVAWRRTVSSAACFSSLSGIRRGAGGGVSSWSSRPPLGDHNEVQEFPLPLSSYPVLMLPSYGTTCRVFNPVTREFTRITYPGGAGGKFCSSSSFPYLDQHGWIPFCTYNDCSLILANGLLSNENPPTISLPPFHTLPNLHSLPIDAADPQLKAKAPPGTDCFFHYTAVQDGKKVIKLLPRDIRPYFGLGSLKLSSAPTNDDCVALLTPSPRLRRDLGIDFAYCRIGDTRWSTVPLPPDHKEFDSQFYNVVYSRRDRLFYAITRGSCIQVIDFNEPDSPRKRLCSAAPVPRHLVVGKEVYGGGIPSLACCESMLVESPQGDPLLVHQYHVPYEDADEACGDEYRTLGFHVYKLSFSQQKLVAEEFNLDGTALFVDYGSASFTVPVCDYPGLLPNSVYFFGLHEIGYYNLLHRAFTHFYQPFEIPLSYITSYPMWVSRPQFQTSNPNSLTPPVSYISQTKKKVAESPAKSAGGHGMPVIFGAKGGGLHSECGGSLLSCRVEEDSFLRGLLFFPVRKRRRRSRRRSIIAVQPPTSW
ncbi:hypothetical protein Tsubulata_050856 [Turnera subulata]|uniref:KIB1-4 beta-propeller domain-containing protein n=1 Tax=Turnera subulata TaxID=218843 RepID=A0A9Q0GC06_9ROSI|nr:hypothetical protein Tsubulata_050856 [Turnera subulata]